MTHVSYETFERGQKELLDAFSPDCVQVLHQKSASLQDLDNLLFHSQGFLEVMILNQLLVNVGLVPVPKELGESLMLLMPL
jgi:hypothetical protein